MEESKYKLTSAHYEILAQAYDLLDKVTDDIPLDSNEDGERIWEAYLKLAVYMKA